MKNLPLACGSSSLSSLSDFSAAPIFLQAKNLLLKLYFILKKKKNPHLHFIKKICITTVDKQIYNLSPPQRLL